MFCNLALRRVPDITRKSNSMWCYGQRNKHTDSHVVNQDDQKRKFKGLSRYEKGSALSYEQRVQKFLGHCGNFHNLTSEDRRFATLAASKSGSLSTDMYKVVHDYLSVLSIIRNYQVHGHLVAHLDPLGVMFEDRTTTISERVGSLPKRVIRSYNLIDPSMERKYLLPGITFIGGSETELPLREIIRRLEMTYCRHIGAEFMYIENRNQVDWIRQKLETPNSWKMSKMDKQVLLARLIRAAGFEAFLQRKWNFEKRFGLEGAECIIPSLKQMIDVLSKGGVDTFIFAMAHRGRLNTLVNVLRKPLDQLFAQFQSLKPADIGSGDVKYHLGTYTERLNRLSNKNVKLSILPNPSHLENGLPTAWGKTRAIQFYRGDHDGSKTCCITVHGDASFCGQGIVYETVHMSDLPAYTVCGCMHLVVNNQVGFTTDPRFSRSSLYCTDVARVINAPVFHVNGDDPESVMRVTTLASEYRLKFKRSAVIDLVCYRKYGHNEQDEPMFTQPLLYTRIRKLKPVVTKYTEQLIKEGNVTQEEVTKTTKEYDHICEAGFQKASKETHVKLSVWIDTPWPGFFAGKNPLKCNPTWVKEEVLKHIGTVVSTPPPASLEFKLHRMLESRLLKARANLIKRRMTDWALGEAFAFGSLLKEGVPVRLSGQDVERGTFSHRHCVYHHQTRDKVTYTPLTHLYNDQAPFTVCNSSLSEYGVLSFEVGFASVNPMSLVMWEGQFGDFCNTAQATIDTVIASGQTKWVRQIGLVMLLPHALEGMGPEHSSARLERFLELSDDDPDVMPPLNKDMPMKQLNDVNWMVINCTVPSNLFHALRRQVALPFRKPLVVMSPKSLLRHPQVVSSFDEYIEPSEFRRVIPENGAAAKAAGSVKKLVFCTGKTYYDLLAMRKQRKQDSTVAISRIEQICPFPYDLLKIELSKYSKAELIWAQEEHKNQGAWYYVRDRIHTLRKHMKDKRHVRYCGRPTSSSPATGNKYIHKTEIQNYMNCVFGK